MSGSLSSPVFEPQSLFFLWSWRLSLCCLPSGFRFAAFFVGSGWVDVYDCLACLHVVVWFELCLVWSRSGLACFHVKCFGGLRYVLVFLATCRSMRALAWDR